MKAIKQEVATRSPGMAEVKVGTAMELNLRAAPAGMIGKKGKNSRGATGKATPESNRLNSLYSVSVATLRGTQIRDDPYQEVFHRGYVPISDGQYITLLCRLVLIFDSKVLSRPASSSRIKNPETFGFGASVPSSLRLEIPHGSDRNPTLVRESELFSRR